MSCSRTTTQWRRRGSNSRPLGLESSTLPLSHCTPFLSVLHARSRNNCSSLNNVLFKNHFRERPFCSWCNIIEDSKHYLFTCNQYRNEYRIFFEAVRDSQPLSIRLLLLGKDTLNNTSNTTPFRAVHEYIKNTKRFDTE